MSIENTLRKIQRVDNAKDIFGLEETPTKVFHATEFNERETVTRTDQSKLEGLRDFPFLERKSRKDHYIENDSGP